MVFVSRQESLELLRSNMYWVAHQRDAMIQGEQDYGYEDVLKGLGFSEDVINKVLTRVSCTMMEFYRANDEVCTKVNLMAQENSPIFKGAVEDIHYFTSELCRTVVVSMNTLRICGFTEEELPDMINEVGAECGLCDRY